MDVMLLLGMFLLALGVYLAFGSAAGVSVVGLGLLIGGLLRGLATGSYRRR